MKVGITEAGDASFDYSWTEKIKDTNMTILITKNITVQQPTAYETLSLAEAGDCKEIFPFTISVD